MKRTDCPLFTVLTPTYNRASTLPRLYASLCRQSFQDFEWLVIDDGSSDDTRSLINTWQAEATLCIRYHYQPNAGKHVAFNVGVAEACGSWIAEIDSDDELLPQALETVIDAWHGIPAPERASFVGVTGLCLDDRGRIVGNRYPSDRFVADTLEAHYKYGVRGEKWGVHRRDVLQEFPFPVPPGLKYVPERIVWSRIARKYRTLYINEPLRIYHSGAPEEQLTKRRFASVAHTALLEHQCVLNSELQWFFVAPQQFLRSAVHYGRASLHLKRSSAEQLHSLRAKARWLWIVATPLAWLAYLRDCGVERAASARSHAGLG